MYIWLLKGHTFEVIDKGNNLLLQIFKWHDFWHLLAFVWHAFWHIAYSLLESAITKETTSTQHAKTYANTRQKTFHYSNFTFHVSCQKMIPTSFSFQMLMPEPMPNHPACIAETKVKNYVASRNPYWFARLLLGLKLIQRGPNRSGIWAFLVSRNISF